LSRYTYEEMLSRALSQITVKPSKWERFEIPKSQILTIGNRTIISNFKEIADVLNRSPEHLLNFILHELATAGSLEESRAILHGKHAKSSIDSLIGRYAKIYVICPVCRKSDTQLKKEKRLSLMVCGACGAISPVRG